MEFDQLIKKMSPGCRQLFEQAVATASSRSHFQLEIEHLLSQALAEQEPDLMTICRHFALSHERIAAGVQLVLEGLKTGNSGFPRISTDVARLLFESWLLASAHFETLLIRPFHLLLALLESDTLRLRLQQASPEFGKLNASDLREQCAALQRAESPANRAAGGTGPTASPALDQFTIDLTAQARAGRIDSAVGRDTEIRQIIDILCRRRQNNPILTGEAGVGKTAVVEGLARRIVFGDVPLSLQNVSLRTLDLGLLQAGAGIKGEFENRLKSVIQEVQQSSEPIILFIDEAHTLIGAGNQAGAGDAANLLKPALARGELRTIAATTWAEYKKYFETDAALTRRFQVVKVNEPDESQATAMLRNLTPALEQHHQVVVLHEAVTAAVKLSHRYIAGRQLPDKCVSLLDTACARVNLSLRSTPPALENCQRRLADIAAEQQRLGQDQRAGAISEPAYSEAVARLEIRRASAESERDALQQRWQNEHAAAAEIALLRQALSRATLEAEAEGSVDENPVDESYADQLTQLAKARATLKALQGESPLLHDCVDAQVVAEVVADWTGIPVGRMQTDEIKGVLALQEKLTERVIGQSHALGRIAQTVQTARAQLGDPRRPLGVFLLAGPSGVGKTETALALAEQLYGSDRAITVINMSEFKEEHKVSLLMGSPPGYVGYGEGGVLTEAVRRKPYSVVLLDEIEKAHPGVQDIFYQVFDKGVLRDGEGRDINFRNTLIILTSNAGSSEIERLCAADAPRPDHAALLEAVGPTLRQMFKPAFLGRLTVIPYFPLDDAALAQVAEMQLATIARRIQTQHGVGLTYGQQLVEHIVAQCRQSDSGARQVSTLLDSTLLPALAERILGRLASPAPLQSIVVDIDAQGLLAIDFAEPMHPVVVRSRKRKTNTVTQQSTA